MNHDSAHCLDYTKDCPKECFRAELQRDFEENRSKFVGVPLTYSHLGGTEECKLVKEKNVDDSIIMKAAIEEIASWAKYIDDDMILRIQMKKLQSEQPELSCDRCLSNMCQVCIRNPNIKDYFVRGES